MLSDIKIGILLPDLIENADGMFGSFLGNIAITKSERVTTYIKCNSLHRITIELLASKLLEILELKTPRAYLAFCPRELIPTKSMQVLMYQEPGVLYKIHGKDFFLGFATEKVAQPSVKQMLKTNQKNSSEELISVFVRNFTELCDEYPLVIGFDEWIANGDRNLGNLLWDGQKDFYLIDHGLSMNESYFNHFGNRLLNLILEHTELTPQKVASVFRKSNKFFSRLNNEKVDLATEKLLILENSEITKIVLLLSDWLKQRISTASVSLQMKKPTSQTKELFNPQLN